MSEQPSTDLAQSEDKPLSMPQAIGKAAIGLAIFAVVTAGLIALTQVNTAERIEEEIRKARSKALLEITPATEHDNDLLNDAFWLQAKELGLSEPAETFVAKQSGQIRSLILPVIAPQGYSGPIRLIVGLTTEGAIKGVRVVEHRETPGLGDKIETKKSDWISSFEGRSLDNTPEEDWRVKKDGGAFDQLTGATITPRAIVQSVYAALKFYQSNREDLLTTAPGMAFQVNKEESTDSASAESVAR